MDNAVSIQASMVPPVSLSLKCLVLVIFVYVGRIHEAVPFLAELPVAKIAFGASLFFAFTGTRDGVTIQAFWSSPITKKVLLLFLIAVLSIPGSIWVGASASFAFSHMVKLLIFLFLVATTVKTDHDARFLGWWFSIAIFLVALFGAAGNKMVAGRIAVGGTYDPNDLALILVMSLPLMYYLLEAEAGWRRKALMGMMVVILFIIPLTGSRGGILALGAVLAAIILKRGLTKSIRLFFAIILMAAIVVSVTPAEHLERFKTIVSIEEDYNMDAQGGRIAIWKRSMKLIAANPLLGSGGGTFMVAEGTTHEYGKWSAAHNSFIQIAVELGIIALVIQLLMIRQIIIMARNASSSWLGKGVEVAMYAYCVGGFFLSWAYTYLLYFVIGLGIVLERLSAEETTQAFEAHGMDEKQ